MFADSRCAWRCECGTKSLHRRFDIHRSSELVACRFDHGFGELVEALAQEKPVKGHACPFKSAPQFPINPLARCLVVMLFPNLVSPTARAQKLGPRCRMIPCKLAPPSSFSFSPPPFLVLIDVFRRSCRLLTDRKPDVFEFSSEPQH